MFGFVLGGQGVVFKTITISTNQNKWNLITDGFGGAAPTRKAVVIITVNAGIEVTSDDTTVAAMDLTGLPDKSQITLINNGEIYGHGGAGGAGKGASVD